MNQNSEPILRARSVANKWFFIKKNIVKKKSNDLSYYKYRILRPLLKLYYKLFRLVNYPSPWLSPACTSILKKHLDKKMSGFEFGSGISTIFLSKHIGKLISIEHYDPWYKKVSGILSRKGIQNVELKLIEASLKKEIPKNPSKSEKYNIVYGSEYFDYSEYVNAIDEIPNESLDLLLVDGRQRVQCIKQGEKKVKKGGIIILDNSEREHYLEAHEYLKKYPKIYTTTGLTDTILWFKE